MLLLFIRRFHRNTHSMLTVSVTCMSRGPSLCESPRSIRIHKLIMRGPLTQVAPKSPYEIVLSEIEATSPALRGLSGSPEMGGWNGI